MQHVQAKVVLIILNWVQKPCLEVVQHGPARCMQQDSMPAAKRVLRYVTDAPCALSTVVPA